MAPSTREYERVIQYYKEHLFGLPLPTFLPEPQPVVNNLLRGGWGGGGGGGGGDATKWENCGSKTFYPTPQYMVKLFTFGREK